MTRIDRRALFTSGAAAALFAATGVSAAPRRGGELRAALSGGSRADVWSVKAPGLFMQAALATVHEGLTEIAADGTLRPLLATAWDSRENGRIWRFDLRKGVTWHDGSPLTTREIAEQLAVIGATETQGHALWIELEEADPNLPYRMAETSLLIAGSKGGTGLYRLHKFDPGTAVHWSADHKALARWSGRMV